MEHRATFTTAHRAGCVCGYVAIKTPYEPARRALIRHIVRPQAAARIADTPREHEQCNLTNWSPKWSICQTHNVYVDIDPQDALTDHIDGQTALNLTYGAKTA